MRSAARRGLPFGRLYRNRMIGLAILGIAHGCLFFPGDILTIYAVTGSILYLFRDWPVRRLVRVGAALLVVQALIAPPLLLATPETPPDIVAMERAILTKAGSSRRPVPQHRLRLHHAVLPRDPGHLGARLVLPRPCGGEIRHDRRRGAPALAARAALVSRAGGRAWTPGGRDLAMGAAGARGRPDRRLCTGRDARLSRPDRGSSRARRGRSWRRR
jgi:hypothetical protein